METKRLQSKERREKPKDDELPDEIASMSASGRSFWKKRSYRPATNSAHAIVKFIRLNAEKDMLHIEDDFAHDLSIR